MTRGIGDTGRPLGRTARLPRLSALLVASLVAIGTGPPEMAHGAEPATVVTRADGTQPVVALTFDDGWHPGHCERILETLLEFGVPATWFPNAAYVGRARRLWRRIAEHHPIANHTTHHRDLRRLAGPRIRQEILSSQRRIESVTLKPMVRLLRPPFGAHDARVRRIAGEVGYGTLVLWDTSAGDTDRGATARRVARAASRGQAGSIVLMHCGPAVTPRVLPAVIARYACAGYRFATVPDLLGRSAGVPARVVCQHDLAGREWRLTEAAMDGPLAPVDPGTLLTLRFGPRGAFGLAGCAAYSVQAALAAEGSISFSRLRRDRAACGDGDTVPASRYLDALVGSSAVRLVDDVLALLDADGRERLRFRAVPPVGLVGDWTVTSLGLAGAPVPERVGGRPLTVSFGPIGTLRGWGGCDTYVGGYGVRGEVVTIGPVLEGSASCSAESDAIQSGLVESLGSVATWAIEDDVLRLRDRDGRDVLQLAPMPPAS